MKALTLSILALLTISTQAASVLAFTGKGYISQNKDWYLSTNDGYTAQAVEVYPDQTRRTLAFFFSNPAAGHSWELIIAAPIDNQITPGSYLGATRFPFADINQPSLDLSGDGRGSNILSGWFQVLELNWGLNGQVSSAAVDFYQLSENNPNSWTFGSMRFNSDVPLNPASVPEPSMPLFTLFTLIGVCLKRKR